MSDSTVPPEAVINLWQHPALVFITVFLLVVLLLIIKSATIIKTDQLGVVLRLGRYRGIITPGFHITIPLLDYVAKVDLERDIPTWRMLSPEQCSAAACSLVLLGRVDLNFKVPPKG